MKNILYWTAGMLVLAAVYYAAAKLGLSLAIVAEQVSAVWPPAGIALAAVLMFGYQVWPGIALGAFLANATANEPLATACGIAVGNTLEALVAARLLRHLVGFDNALERVRDVLGLIVLAAGLSTVMSATIGVTSLCLGGIQPWAAFNTLWWVWWLGDATGDLVMTPVILTWTASRGNWPPSHRGEGLGVLAGLVTMCLIVFTGKLTTDLGSSSAYLIFPFVIWAALRFDQQGASMATLVASSLAIGGTLHGLGPFGTDPIHERLLSLQVFMGVVAITALLLGAALAERRRADDDVRESEERLRIALEAGRMGTWEWNLRSNDVLWSPALEEIHGLAPGTFGGTFDAYLSDIHPDDREFVTRSIMQTVKQGRDYQIEYRLVRPDKSVHWVEARGKLFHDQTGKPVRMSGVCVDITARKLDERRFAVLHSVTSILAESETLAKATPQIIQAVCENLGWQLGAIWQVDSNAQVLRCVEIYHCGPDRFPEFEVITRQRTFDTGIGLPGRVWASGQPAWISDVVSDSNFPRAPVAAKEGLHGAFGFPIRLRAEVLGVIEFFSLQIRQPDKELLRMMATIGSQIGQFIERKREEETRALLAAIVESSDDAIIRKTLDGIILTWNAGAERLFGYSAREVIGRPITVIIPPERYDEEHSILERLRKGHRIEPFETVRVSKQGRIIDISLTIWPIRDRMSRIIGASKVARDITAKKRAEQALRDSEARFHFLAETIPSMVWTANPEGKITYANQRWLEYCGLTREQNACSWPELVLHPDDYERCIARWNEALREGGVYEIEVRNRRYDGAYRWFITRAVALRDAQGRVISWFGVTTDIHDQKDMQEQLRAADRRKDEFLATLAHELRNPLAPIRNALEIMRLAGDNWESVEQARCTIDRQVLQMIRLVDDLLDASRITQGRLELRKEEVDLSAAVASALETSCPFIVERGHELTVTLPSEPVYVHADPTRIAQVIANLLNNACKYSEKGGRIWLTVERNDHEVMVQVKDTGIGIPTEMLSGIFEMFTQADRSFERAQEGLGIGLSLVRRLIELHGGTVEAHSDGPGKGSEFVVRLPVLRQPIVRRQPIALEAPPSGDDHQAAGAVKRRILVADDNRDSADSLAMMLRIIGNESFTAYDGRGAIEAAETFRPDIILLDIGMPKLNGYDAARHIREQPWGKGLLLIAMTGWGQQEDKQRSHEAGFDHHLVKPVDPHALQALLLSHDEAC